MGLSLVDMYTLRLTQFSFYFVTLQAASRPFLSAILIFHYHTLGSRHHMVNKVIFNRHSFLSSCLTHVMYWFLVHIFNHFALCFSFTDLLALGHSRPNGSVVYQTATVIIETKTR